MSFTVTRAPLRLAAHPARRAARRPFCSSPLCRSAATSSIRDEPVRPEVKTQIPGPKTQAIVKDLNKVFDTRSLKMIIDYKKSKGN